MKTPFNLILLCMLLICQQHIIAQSYNLGQQKQSFAYKKLYAYHAQKTVKNNNETINFQPKQTNTNRQKTPVITNNNETINTQPIQTMISVEKTHNDIVFRYSFGGIVFKKYNNIYKSITNTQENILKLQRIQSVVLAYFESQGKIYPNLKEQLKNAPSMKEEIAVFLSYYKEQ